MSDFVGRIVGIVYREDDVEDKLIMAPDGMKPSADEIAETIRFQEKYYRTYVEAFYEREE